VTAIGVIMRESGVVSLDMTDSLLTPEALATWTAKEVADAWKRSSWEVGDPSADALAAEMERRNLDF
jgi:hypothetical protein